jgi:hypothetical protein
LTHALGQWRVRIFDRKFGADFLADVPPAPGVYRLYDAAGTLLYVGKAVNLRRRLAQYRTTRRTKSHRKRRELVRAADRISWQLCESELEASLTEIHLIQELSPRNNIAGAFPFLGASSVSAPSSRASSPTTAAPRRASHVTTITTGPR